MYSKIAINNVKRSFKDYTIYFLTLTFAVCIFYSFNSVGSQKAITEMGSRQAEYINILNSLLGGVSVFVSMILGGLIIYANNFLIKKRKKELGIYMTLGMGKNKISKILVVETFIIGIISLIVGLGIGIIVSQGLSVFTSKLFEVSMSEYKFIISMGAITKTILYFGIIFILVMIFNTFVISKYKLIDMINASKKNENISIKNPVISIIIFLLSVILLVAAYSLVKKIGLNPKNSMFWISILLGVIGTLLSFFSLAGFTLCVMQRSKKVYLNKLNIFILRQINNKINTNFISMTVICLMLFLTIGILSTGLSLKNGMEKALANSTPFDASATMYINEEQSIISIEESLKKLNFQFDNSENYGFYNEYIIDTRIKDLIGNYAEENFKKNLDDNSSKFNVSAIKISEYNKIRELKGESSIDLKNNEVLVTSNNDIILPMVKKFMENEKKVKIKDKVYIIKNEEVITASTSSTGFSSNMITLIVSDEVVEGITPIEAIMNVNFRGDKEASEKKFRELFSLFKDVGIDYDEYGFINGYTKIQLQEDFKGMSVIVLYVGIYIGIIFLIASAAILALQQLSEASDSTERYNALRRIGASEKMINKTIFVQIFIYFMLPLVLALVHSVVGISVANDFLVAYGKPDIGTSSMITALVLVVVYGGYFYATYVGYKAMVKNS